MKRLCLTAGERLLIDRRRERMTQREAASAWDVGRRQYRTWETDVVEDGDDVEGAPMVDLGTIRGHEKCYIFRLRADIEQKDLAARIGISRWWLCLMEHGEVPAETLVNWWDRKVA